MGITSGIRAIGNRCAGLVTRLKATRKGQKPRKFRDPFNEDLVVQRKDKPLPVMGEKQFYFYYHRASGGMIVRYNGTSVIVQYVDTKRLDTWIVHHTEGPLKYIVSGYARRIYVKGGVATLS